MTTRPIGGKCIVHYFPSTQNMHLVCGHWAHVFECISYVKFNFDLIQSHLENVHQVLCKMCIICVWLLRLCSIKGVFTVVLVSPNLQYHFQIHINIDINIHRY